MKTLFAFATALLMVGPAALADKSLKRSNPDRGWKVVYLDPNDSSNDEAVSLRVTKDDPGAGNFEAYVTVWERGAMGQWVEVGSPVLYAGTITDRADRRRKFDAKNGDETKRVVGYYRPGKESDDYDDRVLMKVSDVPTPAPVNWRQLDQLTPEQWRKLKKWIEEDNEDCADPEDDDMLEEGMEDPNE